VRPVCAPYWPHTMLLANPKPPLYNTLTWGCAGLHGSQHFRPPLLTLTPASHSTHFVELWGQKMCLCPVLGLTPTMLLVVGVVGAYPCVSPAWRLQHCYMRWAVS
jgi:hypothetical protein